MNDDDPDLIKETVKSEILEKYPEIQLLQEQEFEILQEPTTELTYASEDYESKYVDYEETTESEKQPGNKYDKKPYKIENKFKIKYDHKLNHGEYFLEP